MRVNTLAELTWRYETVIVGVVTEPLMRDAYVVGAPELRRLTVAVRFAKQLFLITQVSAVVLPVTRQVFSDAMLVVTQELTRICTAL